MIANWFINISVAAILLLGVHAVGFSCAPNEWIRSDTSCIPLEKGEIPTSICLVNNSQKMIVGTSQNIYSKNAKAPRWLRIDSFPRRGFFELFSCNGQAALFVDHSGSCDEYTVLETQTGKIHSKFYIEHPMGQLSLSGDGRLLSFTQPYADILEFWDTKNGSRLSWPLQRESAVEHAELIGNDHCLIAGRNRLSYFQLPVNDEPPKRLWEKKFTESTPRNSGSNIRIPNAYFNVASSEDGATIAQIRDDVLTVINAKDGTTLGRHTIDDVNLIETAVSHDSKFVAVTYSLPIKTPLDGAGRPKPVTSILLPSKGGFHIYSVETRKAVYQSGVISLPQTLAFSRTKHLLAIALWDGTVTRMIPRQK